MRITKSQLKSIVREELNKALTEKQSIMATIKPIGSMAQYILKTLSHDEDRDVDYGIPRQDPGFVDDKQWADLKHSLEISSKKRLIEF